jgi:hypothetical protein
MPPILIGIRADINLVEEYATSVRHPGAADQAGEAGPVS